MKTNPNEITVLGTGKESRDFIYIYDLTRAVDIIIHKAIFNGNAYNCSNGIEIIISEAVKQLALVMEWNGKISYSQQTRIGDPINWKAEVSWLNEMQYKPVVSLQEGLNYYVKWLKKENK
jgi:UDP-glucose 4-epimerase